MFREFYPLYSIISYKFQLRGVCLAWNFQKKADKNPGKNLLIIFCAKTNRNWDKQI